MRKLKRVQELRQSLHMGRAVCETALGLLEAVIKDNKKLIDEIEKLKQELLTKD